MARSKTKTAIAKEWREDQLENERRRKEEERRKRAEEKDRKADEQSVKLSKISDGMGSVASTITALVLMVVCTLLTMSLMSHTAEDPGFFVTGNEVAKNLCGLVGAWSSDFLFGALGLSAWWIDVWIFSAVLQNIRSLFKGHKKGDSLVMLVGVIILVAASVGLERMHFAENGAGLVYGAGGMAGQVVAGELSMWLGVWGSSIVLSLAFALGLSMVLCFSWGSVAEKIGSVIFAVLQGVKKIFSGREKDSENDEPAAKESSEPARKQMPALPEKPPVAATPSRVEPTLPSAEPEVAVIEPALAGKGAAAKKSRGIKPEFAGAGKNKEIADKDSEENAPGEAVDYAESVDNVENAPEGSVQVEEAAPARIAPSLDLLIVPPADRAGITDEAIYQTSRLIESKLKTYHIRASVKGAQAGPVITQYWLELADGVRGSKVEELRKDLMRALAVPSVRIVSSVPGQPYMGLEIPNPSVHRQAVYLSEIIGSDKFAESDATLPLAIGKDIAGESVILDLVNMPHLLVGGTTGSGKSIGINAMILSLLYKCEPSMLRLVLIDPKMVEFSMYQDIPHLLCPVVTDMGKAGNALAWLVAEMDRRYTLMGHLGVRSFTSYNSKIAKAEAAGKPLMNPFLVTPEEPDPSVPLEKIPYIVCFIDELADLILVHGKAVEMHIMRLAQKARAAGIHMVLATQRPSADIVTPIIKANISTRICFQVASRYDSQTVLEDNGAQDLLGRGDMLFKRPGNPLIRIQGCMVEEAEVERVVDELRSQGAPQYVDQVTEGENDNKGGRSGSKSGGEKDVLYDEAVKLVIEQNRASTSFVQRRFGIGYNRAANLLESMEAAGIVSKANQAGKREVLVQDNPALNI